MESTLLIVLIGLAGGLALAGVVAQSLSSFGMHKDYHRPSDEADKIDFGHLESAARLAFQAAGAVVFREGSTETELTAKYDLTLSFPSLGKVQGGVAVILHALQILLNEQGWKNFAQLTVFFNGDEESGSNGSAKMRALPSGWKLAARSPTRSTAWSSARNTRMLIGPPRR